MDKRRRKLEMIALVLLALWAPVAVCWSQDKEQEAGSREIQAILSRLAAAADKVDGDAGLTKSTAGADAAVLAALALHSRDARYRALALQAHRVGEIVADEQPDRRKQLAPLVADLRKTLTTADAPAKATKRVDAARLAPRPGLMWRMDRSLKLVREEITNGEQLAERKRDVEHDIAVLRMLAKLIGEDHYDFSDDDEFQQLRRTLAAEAEAMAKAAAAGDVEQLQLRRAAARESCKACHKSFRN